MTNAVHISLPFRIRHRLAYSPDNFFLHDGVAPLVDSLNSALIEPRFQLFFIYGGPRSGKTHLSVFLTSLLTKLGKFPHLLDGAHAKDSLRERSLSPRSFSGEVVIVDESERYFQSLPPGESGSFVDLIERIRLDQGKVVFLGATRIGELLCDQHVTSRLGPGAGYEMGIPAESDLEPLIAGMARQRGINLSSRKASFLSPRLNRSIEAIEEYLDRVAMLSSTLSASVDFPLLADAMPRSFRKE